MGRWSMMKKQDVSRLEEKLDALFQEQTVLKELLEKVTTRQADEQHARVKECKNKRGTGDKTVGNKPPCLIYEQASYWQNEYKKMQEQYEDACIFGKAMKANCDQAQKVIEEMDGTLREYREAWKKLENMISDLGISDAKNLEALPDASISGMAEAAELSIRATVNFLRECGYEVVTVKLDKDH